MLQPFTDQPTKCRAGSRFIVVALRVILLAAWVVPAGAFAAPPPWPCPEPPDHMPPADVCPEEGSPESMPGWLNEPPGTGKPATEGSAAGAATGSEGPPTPAVSLHVRVLANAVAGKNLEYHIDIDNRSEAAAHHVVVRDPLPANARFVKADPEPATRAPDLLWRFGTLAPGAHKEIVLVLTPTGAGDVENCARVQFEHGQCVRTRVTKPVVSVHKTGPAQALLLDPLHFQLTVANDGTAAANDVKLTDSLAAGLEHASGKSTLSWEIGTLEPGQKRVVDYQVIARTPGKQCNQAVVTADGGLQAKAESCVSVTEAKMALTMHGPARRYVNLPAMYEITVSNTGTAPLNNVQVVNPLPLHTAFVSAGAEGRLSGTQVMWSVGGLEPGASRTVEVVLRAQVEGRICNRATATADRGLAAQAEACTEFKGVSALLTELIDTEDPVEVGGNTSYVVTIFNQGSKPVTHLVVVADVPAQETLVSANGPSPNRRDGAKLVFDPTTLQPQATARYTISVKAVAPGDVRFRLDVTADQLTGGPVLEEESTTLYTDLPAGGRPPVEGLPRSRRSARR